MKIGLAYDLKSDMAVVAGDPDDALEEYDGEETVESIARALPRLHHRVVRLGGGRDFLTAVLTEKVDMVFTIAEGRGNYRSREGQVPAVLEMLRIPMSVLIRPVWPFAWTSHWPNISSRSRDHDPILAVSCRRART